MLGQRTDDQILVLFWILEGLLTFDFTWIKGQGALIVMQHTMLCNLV